MRRSTVTIAHKAAEIKSALNNGGEWPRPARMALIAVRRRGTAAAVLAQPE
jgi:hypothetical protein